MLINANIDGVLNLANMSLNLGTTTMIKIVKAIPIAANVMSGVRIAFLNFAVLSLRVSKISASL